MTTYDKNNYKSIPAIGQFDSMACWAACLTWWLKAVKDGRPSWTQSQVIAMRQARRRRRRLQSGS